MATNKGFENKQYGKGNNKNARKAKQRQKAPVVTQTTAKQKPFYAKKPADKNGAPFEYKMNLASATDILRDCPSSIRPEQYLCDYVNNECGLIGWCQRVIIEG